MVKLFIFDKLRPLMGETNSSSVHVLVLGRETSEDFKDYVSILKGYAKDGKLGHVPGHKPWPNEAIRGLELWNYIIAALYDFRRDDIAKRLSEVLGVEVVPDIGFEALNPLLTTYTLDNDSSSLENLYSPLRKVRTPGQLNKLLNGVLVVTADWFFEPRDWEVLRDVFKPGMIYENGNRIVLLYPETGKKIRLKTDFEEYRPEFPESIDLNVSYRCDVGCPYCYISATPNGEEWRFDQRLLSQIFSSTGADIFDLWRENDSVGLDYHPFIEVAINVNNLFDFGNLKDLVEDFKVSSFIPNLTLHYTTALKHPEIITDLPAQWVGVSTASAEQIDRVRSLFPEGRIVFHVINGVFRDIEKVKNENVLILGYKSMGRGVGYRPRLWEWDVVETLMENGNNVAFDDLAVEQLRAKEHIGDDYFDLVHMGMDRQHAMFIDLVKREFAHTSTSERRFKIEGRSLKEMWDFLQSQP